MPLNTGVLVLSFMALWSSLEASVGPEKLQNAVTAFSTDLFKELTKGEAKNLIVSPVSVSIVLAMLMQGARGSTTNRLKEALRLDSIEAKELYGALVKHYQQDLSGTNTTLELSNRLFLNSSYQVIPEFKNTLVQSFLSDVERVAFGTGEGLRAVNGWASRATHGKIQTILDEEPKSDTALLLANAIYFKSPWQMPFSNLETREGDFTVRPGHTVKVPFMRAVLEVHFTESKELDAKLLMLPFKGQRFSLLMILSNKKNGLQHLVSQLSPSNVMRMILPIQRKSTNIKIPRFKLESNLDLQEPLKQLGLALLFTKPDFDGISTSGEKLVVSEFIQKATVEIDEQGGEAAVITVAAVGKRVGIPPAAKFEADHPFFAMIVDHEKKIPLFMITVADPSKER